MTSFAASQHYSPLITLIVGIATFLGLLGAGIAALRLIRVRIPPPWLHVTAVLLGIELFSLFVQLAGMTSLASRNVLIAVWVVLVVLGGVASFRWAGCLRPVRQDGGRDFSVLPLAVGLTAIIINLLLALAPSTKIDELYYHMLLPSRIVTDGALKFYREPWQTAILPQMIYQISLSPLHALQRPDGGNVVSWALNLTLLWFAWYLLTEHKKTSAWTYFWVAAMIVGLHSAVWNVTGGSHAMGDLAMAASVIAFCLRRELMMTFTPPAFAAMFSILLVSGASSKMLLLPLCLIMLLMMTIILYASIGRRERASVALALTLPWVIFLLPIAIWTFFESGSPFGPLLSGVFPASAYNVKAIQQTLRETTCAYRLPLFDIMKDGLLNYSPLVWVGTAGFLMKNELEGSARLAGAAFLLMQTALIFLFLPYQIRYLSGIPYGLLICFALSAPLIRQNVLLSRRSYLVAALAFLLPWLGIQLYYAQRLVPVVLGMESEQLFYRRYVAFYEDYKRLDELLPNNGVLLATDCILSSVYAPRPVYMDPADLPEGKEVFFFASYSGNDELRELIPGYKIGAALYKNSGAVIETYRTPGRPPRVGTLFVARLEREKP